jgi:hypothetical protein
VQIEEWFGINGLDPRIPLVFNSPFTPDTLEPRAAFDRMKNIWTGN